MDTKFFNGEGISTTTINYTYQDNKSTILLAENQKGSSSRHTRYLDMRYFFVTDKIKKGEVKVSFCHTHDMLGNFLTKPLQGTQFVHMRSKILNLPSNASATVQEKCVGEFVKRY